MRFRKKPVEIEAVQWNGRVEDFKAFGEPPLPITLAPSSAGGGCVVGIFDTQPLPPPPQDRTPDDE